MKPTTNHNSGPRAPEALTHQGEAKITNIGGFEGFLGIIKVHNPINGVAV